jgi:hypothetical protein
LRTSRLHHPRWYQDVLSGQRTREVLKDERVREVLKDERVREP